MTPTEIISTSPSTVDLLPSIAVPIVGLVLPFFFVVIIYIITSQQRNNSK